jgi:hypothetical protein
MPVYVDGFAYAGFINIQQIEKAWPATAGINDQDLRMFEILEKSSIVAVASEDDLLKDNLVHE